MRRQQRTFTGNPWVYVPADGMSDDDQLVEQQLRRDMDTEKAAEKPFSVFVELLGNSTNLASTVVGPTRRKRRGSTTVEEASSKRIKADQVTRENAAATTPKAIAAAPKKLGRPKKLQQIRQENNNKLAVQKVKGDIYEVTDARPQKLVSRPAANTKTHRSGAKTAPEVDQSNPATKLAAKKSLRSTVPREGQGSPFRNEGVAARQNTKSEVRTAEKRREKKGNMPMSSPTAGIAHAGQRVKGSPVRRSKKQSSKKRRQSEVHDRGEEAADELEDLDDVDIPRSGQGEVEEEPEIHVSDHEGFPQGGDSSEVEEEQMDLLGQDEEWKKVLKSARSVSKTKLKTEDIRKLRKAIVDAKHLYRQLLPGADIDYDALKELNEQLQRTLEAIENHINSIAESKVPTKESETVGDLFGRAIPSMVLLLDAAFILRTAQPRGLHSFHAMEEIVRLQDMTIELCVKAKCWKARPLTNNPIIKPTTSVIYPYIRDMRKVFSTKLKELQREDKIKQNARITAQRDKERLELSQREAEVSTQQSSQRGPDRELLSRQDREKERQQWRKSLRRPVPIMRQSRNVNAQRTQHNGHASPHVWTEAEVGELAVQLGNKNSRDLPAEMRYLTALNTPLLQNMLPEHIREKALSLKPYLMDHFGPASWICSIE